MRRLQCALLAAVAAIGFASIASAADMPVRARTAPVPVPVVYNWSGIYLGGGVGYQWATVHDTNPAFVQTDSTVRTGIVSGLVGAQYQFNNMLPWAGVVIGVEAAINAETNDNSTGNFTSCANPAYTCGLRRLDNLTTVGGRLGLAFDRWLVTGSGGWASANFKRTDFNLATGLVGTGGGGSSARHNGAYAGAGLEYALYTGVLADMIVGIDYQHLWLNSQTDINDNGVGHTLSAKDDIVRGRLTVKFNPWR